MTRLPLLLLCLLMVGCQAPRDSSAPIPPEAVVIGEAGWANVYRVDDVERGVTCYVTAFSDKFGGISCLPTERAAVAVE